MVPEAATISETLGVDEWCQYGVEASPTGLSADASLMGLYYVVSKDATAVPKDPTAQCEAVVVRLAYHHVEDGPELLLTIAESLLPGGHVMIIDQEVGWSLDEQPRCSADDGCNLFDSSTFHPGNPEGHVVPQVYVMRDIRKVSMDIDVQKPWEFYSTAISSSHAFAIVVPK